MQKVVQLLEKEKWVTKTLEDICTEIYAGNGVTRAQLGTGTHPAVKSVDVNSRLPGQFHQCISFVNQEEIDNPKHFGHGDILISSFGDEESVGTAVLYTGHEQCLAGNNVVVVKSSENTRYIFHMLSTRYYRRQINSLAVQSDGHHLHMKSVRQIKIPLPPRHIQDRVADYLDLCMELQEDLRRQLEQQKNLYQNFQDLLASFAG